MPSSTWRLRIFRVLRTYRWPALYLQNQNGQHFPVTVTDKTETTITFDANNEMAGKELNFKIELVEVK